MSSHQIIVSMLKNPLLTGAVMPSSRFLARAMTQEAIGAQFLLELGAGTGAITQELVKQLPQMPLISVEYQEDLAKRLTKRFPNVDVRQNTAKAVLDSIPGNTKKNVLISSLPFRSLPLDVHTETVESIFNFFQRCPHSWMIQFTYGRIAPFPVPNEYEWRFATKVWCNVPPASVWVLAPRAKGNK